MVLRIRYVKICIIFFKLLNLDIKEVRPQRHEMASLRGGHYGAERAIR